MSNNAVMPRVLILLGVLILKQAFDIAALLGIFGDKQTSTSYEGEIESLRK